MKYVLLLLIVLFSGSVYAQHSPVNTPVTKANYALAARFSPKKIDKMVFSLGVDAHWFKKTDRFWYMYETSDGKKWYVVDALKGEKKPLFDNASLAAKLTRISDDAMDAQHLNIDSMKLVKEESKVRKVNRVTLELPVRLGQPVLLGSQVQLV